VAFYVSVGQFDRFQGGEEATFQLGAVEAAAPDDAAAASQPSSAETQPSAAAIEGQGEGDTVTGGDAEVVASAAPQSDASSTVAPSTSGVATAESATLAIVGDSQANALAINLPSGIEAAFPRVVNGSVDGCGVLDSGRVESAVAFRNNFAICDGWQQKWADAASGADVALVVVGAWDVFDVVDGEQRYVFGTAEGDQHFADGLRSGIDAMLAEGANVGLLEAACMRPVDVQGAGVRALPERADDARVAHLNDVMRSVAAEYGPEVQVIDGPDEWCTDETIATDLGYRWDGVHVYKPGANLIMETIAPQLLSLAAA